VMESERLSTLELVREITSKGTQLVSKEVELAISEAKSDLRAELDMAKSFAGAAVCAIATLNLLLVAGVLALATAMPAWQAALVFAAVAGAATGALALVGWRKRVTRPLARTRKTLEEDVRWAKQQIA